MLCESLSLSLSLYSSDSCFAHLARRCSLSKFKFPQTTPPNASYHFATRAQFNLVQAPSLSACLPVRPPASQVVKARSEPEVRSHPIGLVGKQAQPTRESTLLSRSQATTNWLSECLLAGEFESTNATTQQPIYDCALREEAESKTFAPSLLQNPSDATVSISPSD